MSAPTITQIVYREKKGKGMFLWEIMCEYPHFHTVNSQVVMYTAEWTGAS